MSDQHYKTSFSQAAVELFNLWIDSVGWVTILGLLMILAAMGLILYEQTERDTYSATTEADIILLWDMHTGPRGINENYVKYRYSAPEAKGQIFTHTDVVSNERYATLNLGQTIDIRYDPQRPQFSRLDQFNERILRLVHICFVVGIVLMIADPLFGGRR